MPSSSPFLLERAEQEETEQPQMVLQRLWPVDQTQRLNLLIFPCHSKLIYHFQCASFWMSALSLLALPSTNYGNVTNTSLILQCFLSHIPSTGFDKHSSVGGACGEYAYLTPLSLCVLIIPFRRICVDTGRGCSLLLTSPLAASQNFEVSLYGQR